MDRYETTRELQELIGGYLKERGLVLVELILQRSGSGLSLRVLADRPEGGISVGECGSLNTGIGALLESREDLLAGSYILEVSSPGLDRPLREKGDFARSIGKRAHFFLLEPAAGKIELEGIIEKIEGESVFARIQDDLTEIPMSAIRMAKQVLNI